MYKTKADKAKVVAQLIAERAKRSDVSQIKELDARLGVDVGAKKERARLLKAQ